MPPPLPTRADVVVLGAGIGGLTAASLLAKAGLDVVVLEMDARPGGYLAGFRRREFVFDTAIHWLNQCGEGGVVRRIFELVGPGAPEAPPLHHIRRYRGDSFDYLLTDRPDDLRDQLAADHPSEARAIQSFFAASRRVGRAFSDLSLRLRAKETMSALERARFGLGMVRPGLQVLRWVGKDTDVGFSQHFSSPALRQMFASEERLISCLTPVGWAYEGDYQQAPKGGSRAFPRFLASAIESFGGKIVYRARAERIRIVDGNAAAVEFAVGGSEKRSASIDCRWVLAACDLETVYETMLPEGTVDAGTLQRLRSADLYDSTVTISLGLNRPSEELGFGEELAMLTRDDVPRSRHNCGDPHEAGISVLAPSVRDPSLAPPGKGTLTFYTTASINYGERWGTGPDDLRGDQYRAFKQQYAETIIDRVSAAFSPDLRKAIEVCEVATPITHRRYTGNRDGSIMAAKPSVANIRAKIAGYRTPVPNLLLAGHWAEYGGGVPVAVRAGANAALLVLRRERPPAFRTVREVFDGRRAPSDVDPEILKPLTVE